MLGKRSDLNFFQFLQNKQDIYKRPDEEKIDLIKMFASLLKK